jgi:hypothetical protein
MILHKFKLEKHVCNKILDIISNQSTEIKIRAPGARKISQTYFKVADERSDIIFDKYAEHKESGYINFQSPLIKDVLPDSLFDQYRLKKTDVDIVVIKVLPGKIHIPHIDSYINLFYNYKSDSDLLLHEQRKNETRSRDKVIRLWITLTEPKFGHILIVEDKALYWLEQGTMVSWQLNELHTAANLGYEDRYVMTITGFTV